MMKKIIVCIHVLVMFISCSDGFEDTNDQNFLDRSKIEQDDVIEKQKSFAKILSQAVYNEEKVRSFIKEQALLQFDHDYDVFYPFVKDRIIDGNQTFRDVLLSYCDEDELVKIEETLPLLNILVPDLSLYCDFTPNNWDINDDEVAVISRDDNDNHLYVNGESALKLPLSEVPGFPCLVVKNNERIEVNMNPKTRSAGGLTYKFVNEIFDGSKPLPSLSPQTRHSNFEEDVELTVTSYYMSESELDMEILDAYDMYKDNPYGYDRDYIYYGIKNKTDIGELKRNVRETLYRFRLNPRTYKMIADQGGSDGFLQSTTEEKRYLTADEIVKRVWTDGVFEFIFTCMVSDQNSSESMKTTLVMPLKPSEVFAIKKVSVEHINSTMFRHSKNTYTVNPDNLESKWIFPDKHSFGNQIFLQPWDLYSKSLVIHMSVDERDDGQTIERTESYQNEYAHKADFVGEGTFGKFGAKIGYGFTSKESKSTSTKVTTTVGSDHLGTLTFYYYDPVITDKRTTSSFLFGKRTVYKPYTVNNGSVEMTLIPRKIR